MKTVTITLVLYFIYLQNSIKLPNEITSLNNENIKYELAMQTLSDPGEPCIAYYIVLKALDSIDLSKTQLNQIYKWFDDDNKDWAANVIFYAISKKNAYSMGLFSSEVWRKRMKKREILFWKEYLDEINDKEGPHLLSSGCG